MLAITTIDKAERNLNIVKELFTAICNGDAATMGKLYHEKVQLESVKRAPKNKKQIIYAHLFFFRVAQKQEIVVDPNPRYKIINENTIRVLFDMYLITPKKKNTFYTYPIFFTVEDKQIIKEVHKTTNLTFMKKYFIAYGIKGLLSAIPIPFLQRDLEKKETEMEDYYMSRFFKKQEQLRLAEHPNAPIRLRNSKKT